MPDYSVENEEKRKKFVHDLASKVQELQKEYNDLLPEIRKNFTNNSMGYIRQGTLFI